jgi:hypothetical protein
LAGTVEEESSRNLSAKYIVLLLFEGVGDVHAYDSDERTRMQCLMNMKDGQHDVRVGWGKWKLMSGDDGLERRKRVNER